MLLARNEGMMNDVELEVMKGIRRAIEELGFNGAMTRLPGSPSTGIGEEMIITLRRIEERLETLNEYQERIADALEEHVELLKKFVARG